MALQPSRGVPRKCSGTDTPVLQGEAGNEPQHLATPTAFSQWGQDLTSAWGRRFLQEAIYPQPDLLVLDLPPTCGCCSALE